MKLKDMTVEDALEYLEIEIEETAEGSRLVWGPNDDRAGEKVTLADAEEMVSGTTESWEIIRKALSNDGSTVKAFYVDQISAWTVIKDELKTDEIPA